MTTKKKKDSDSLVNVKKLAKILYDKSCKWGEQYNIFNPSDKSNKVNISNKASELAKAIDSHNWGGHDSAVRNCFEIVLGEKFPAQKEQKAIHLETGIVITFLSGSSGKGIPVGEPLMCVDGSNGRMLDKEGERYIPTSIQNSKYIKISTLYEIENFLEVLIKNKEKIYDSLAIWSLFI
jgi:hypothetical protein